MWAAGTGWAGSVTLDGAPWSLLGEAREWHFVTAQPYAEVSPRTHLWRGTRIAVRLDGR